MSISKEELSAILDSGSEMDKISTVSNDGKTLLIRIPKQISTEFDIVAGNKVEWKVDLKEKKINLDFKK